MNGTWVKSLLGTLFVTGILAVMAWGVTQEGRVSKVESSLGGHVQSEGHDPLRKRVSKVEETNGRIDERLKALLDIMLEIRKEQKKQTLKK